MSAWTVKTLDSLAKPMTFARDRGFSLRVASNSWRKDAKEGKEGNAKYVCKKMKSQKQLVP
ncbi:hypothetical protein GQ600_16640 [Phytophthora cactorum]|nr:hypothetical protein GQ600_16640 [Phytophthora cactorum]